MAAAASPEPSPTPQSLDFVWRTFVAGGVAGSLAKTVVAPLDRVKILFQASNPHFAKYTGSWAGVAAALRELWAQDGAAGLFRGHSVTVARVFPYAAIKFVAYEQIRAGLIRTPAQETAPRRLLAGALAGVTSVIFTYPLEVVRVRLAFETSAAARPSVAFICRQLYHERPVTSASSPHRSPPPPSSAPRVGLANFYRGFAPTLLGMLPYAGISFLTHDTAGDLLRHPSVAKWSTIHPRPGAPPPPHGRRPPLRYWAELTAGGLAGVVAQTASYPLEVIRRRMQVSGAVGDGHRLRIAETARLVMAERGLRGFFVGLSIAYVKALPMVAVSFYTYERLKLWLGI